MRNLRYRSLLPVALIAVLVLAVLVPAQYREYLITGKVCDTQKNPIQGAEISLRDVKASRGYSMKTNKKGEFRLAGLPHGVYAVEIVKEGYALKQDEWRFETPQDTMQKVEIPAITLLSQTQVMEIQKLKEAEAGVKDAADLIRKDDSDGAVVRLKDLLAANPKDPNVLYLIGIAYAKKSMLAEAQAAFLEVTELAPKFAAAYYQLGVACQGLDQPEKALEAYGKANALDPANANAFYNSGLILFKLNRIDEALAVFEKAASIKPDDPAYLEMAGRCYIHQADFQKAIDYLERAMAGTAEEEKKKFLEGLITKLKEQVKK